MTAIWVRRQYVGVDHKIDDPPFFRLEPEVPGGFGERSVLDTSVHPPTVHRLHFEFMGWDGDDLVESFPCFLVSERLGRAMTDERLAEFELADVEVTVDEQFQEFFPQSAMSLPTWSWLKPRGEPWASDLWINGRADLYVSAAALNVIRRFSLAHCEMFEARRSDEPSGAAGRA
jgi:hypothetical protein